MKTPVPTSKQSNALIALRLRNRANEQEAEGFYTFAELLREAARRLDRKPEETD